MKDISNLVKGLIILVSTVIITACTSNREPTVPQYNTGMKKNGEWNSYNKYAKSNDKPILDFAATTLKYKKNDRIVPNYNKFLTTDPKVTVQTKWHNCKVTDLFEFKFYMPDGRLAHYAYYKPKNSTTKWTLGRSIYVKRMPSSDIHGKWRVEIFANGKYVMKKSFLIGKDNSSKNEVREKVKIGYAPYWNSKLSTWNHNKSASIYSSQALLRDRNDVDIIPTYQILRNIGNPQFLYENYKEQLAEDLKDDNGVILPIAKKFNMDYIIMGKVLSAKNNDTHDTKFETYIIDVNKRKIIDTITSTKSFYRSDFVSGMSQKHEGMHPKRIEVYKVLYEDLKNKLLSLK